MFILTKDFDSGLFFGFFNFETLNIIGLIAEINLHLTE